MFCFLCYRNICGQDVYGFVIIYIPNVKNFSCFVSFKPGVRRPKPSVCLFIEIVLVCDVSMFVCVSAPEAWVTCVCRSLNVSGNFNGTLKYFYKRVCTNYVYMYVSHEYTLMRMLTCYRFIMYAHTYVISANTFIKTNYIYVYVI